ncbi:unnamed protein product [Schistosoma spindalis]|nr:unnamed protein product [Schistosoma spindale]
MLRSRVSCPPSPSTTWIQNNLYPIKDLTTINSLLFIIIFFFYFLESVSLELLDVLPTSVLLNVFDVKILDQCIICMEKYCIGDEVIRLPCFHAFHDDCFVDWILECLDCPICRWPAFEFE